MSKSDLVEVEKNITEKKRLSFSWKDSVPIQHLLDSISAILANEYIEVAKKNRDVFSEIVLPRLGGARNDGMEK